MVSAIHAGRREDQANREVVRRAPIGVDPLEQVWRESVHASLNAIQLAISAREAQSNRG